MKLKHLLAAVSLGAVSLSAHALTVPGPVVSAAWLHSHLKDVVVLDVEFNPKAFTSTPQYAMVKGKKVLSAVGGHIPDARLVEFEKIRVKDKIDGKEIGGMLPDKTYFQNLMQDVGAMKGKPIVITQEGVSSPTTDAGTRLFWQLHYYGDKNVALLDGGNAAWLQAGYSVSSAPSATTKGDWAATGADKSILASMGEVEHALKSHGQLVDARAPQQYYGVTYKKPAVKAAGHLSGAKNFPFELQTKQVGKAAMFLSAKDYDAIFKQLGVNTSKPAITYCNTGHLASGAWFVLHEIAGNKNTRLYDGSMTEWTTLGHPVVGLN